VPTVKPSPGEPAGFVYTSGNDRRAKGVVLTHKISAPTFNGLTPLFRSPPTIARCRSCLWAHPSAKPVSLHLAALGCAMAINDEVSKLVSNLPR